LDIEKLFGVKKDKVETFINELFLTAIVANSINGTAAGEAAGEAAAAERRARAVLELVAYWVIMYEQLGLGDALIPTFGIQEGGNGEQLALQNVKILNSAQEAVLATVPEAYKGTLATSFNTLNIKNDDLQAKINDIKTSSKGGWGGLLVTAALGLVGGLAAAANNIIDIVGPSVLRAEINAATASVAVGAVLGVGETSIDALQQGTLALFFNGDALAMQGVHAVVTTGQAAPGVIMGAVSSVWGAIGTVAKGTRGGVAADAAAAAVEKENMSKLAQATFDIEWATVKASERAENITGQTSTALVANPKGTETDTLELQTFFNSIANRKLAAQPVFAEYTTNFLKINWAWVSAYNAEKWAAYSMTQANRLALQVLVVAAKNPTAVSLVLFKLGIGAVAGLAILPAVDRYLKGIHSKQKLELVLAEMKPQIDSVNNEIDRLLTRLRPPAIADAQSNAAAGATAGRRLTSRHRRRHAPSLPRRTRRSSSGRRQRSSRRRRE